MKIVCNIKVYVEVYQLWLRSGKGKFNIEN